MLFWRLLANACHTIGLQLTTALEGSGRDINIFYIRILHACTLALSVHVLIASSYHDIKTLIMGVS